MSKLLETAFIHLLNKDEDKAEELFHRFLVAEMRKVNESMRQGDELALEGFDADDIETDHYFTEADLEDAEGTEDSEALDGAAGDLEDDLGTDADADLGVDGDDADLGVDGDEGTEGDDSKIEELADDLSSMQDELDRLVADLEAEMSKLKGDDTDFDAAAGEDDAGLDGAEDADLDADEALVKEGELSLGDEDEDEFDDITEGVLEDLLKVSVSNDDGREQGGKSITQNTKSIPAAKGKAAPIKIKDTPHTSFERETAPAVKVEKKGRNAMSSADEAQKPASLKMPVQPNK